MRWVHSTATALGSVGLALALTIPFSLSACTNPNLNVGVRSVDSACIGAAIGSRSAATITMGDEPSRGSIRVRWLLSADVVPSSDDRVLAGSDSDRLIGALGARATHAINNPNLVIPADTRLGPQYLILVATDTGDPDAGIAFKSIPITIRQCPAPAACDMDYRTLQQYNASASRSNGPRPHGLARDRPIFISDRSQVQPWGLTVGGIHGTHGLLLRYGAAQNFVWGKSLSHCIKDSVDSVASFNDGTIAAAVTFVADGKEQTELVAFSTSGELLWRRVLVTSPTYCTSNTPGCYLSSNAAVAVDSNNDSAIVAVRRIDGPLDLIRIDRHGNEIGRRRHTQAELGLDGGPADIATPRAPGSHKEFLVSFINGFAMFDEALGLRWKRVIGDGTFFPSYPYQSVEVEMCTSEDIYIATTGVEYFHGQDVVSRYDRSGRELWAINIRTATARGAAPRYTGPTGLLRQHLFGLRCNEQDLPEVVFTAGDDSHELPREVRAVTFRHDGSVANQFRGTHPAGGVIGGASGISASRLYFLSLNSNMKFTILSGEALGWGP